MTDDTGPNRQWFHLEFKRVPEISDGELLRLAKHIKPLRYSKGGRLLHIVEPEGTEWLRDTGFTWLKAGGPAERYHEVGCVITYHDYGAPSLFKPSVAEVLACVVAQVNPADLRRVMGFALDESRDMDVYNVIGEHHFAKCWLFERLICGDGLDEGTVVGFEAHDGPVIRATDD